MAADRLAVGTRPSSTTSTRSTPFVRSSCTVASVLSLAAKSLLAWLLF